MVNTLSDKSGDSKTFVDTIVANEATEKIWFNTTGLDLAGIKYY
jgi:hypothetical protein